MGARLSRNPNSLRSKMLHHSCHAQEIFWGSLLDDFLGDSVYHSNYNSACVVVDGKAQFVARCERFDYPPLFLEPPIRCSLRMDFLSPGSN